MLCFTQSFINFRISPENGTDKGKHKGNSNSRNSPPSRVRGTIWTRSGITGTRKSMHDNFLVKKKSIKVVRVFAFDITENISSQKG